MQKNYLYAITHRDIPLTQQAIQAAHAQVEYAYSHGRPSDHHPSIIHLTVKSQQELERLRGALNLNGIPTAEFHEPYQDWGLTAIACQLSEEDRHHLSHLQLWRIK